MDKEPGIFSRPITVQGLLITAFVIELLNMILTVYLGSLQADSCTKSAFPAQVSIVLGAFSILTVLATIFIGKNKITAFVIFFFWSAAIIGIGFFLLPFSAGGITLCS